jgi:hypothetical protein
MQSKLEEAMVELANEKRKETEIQDQYQEKSRQLKKLQNMYDQLKRKSSVDLIQKQVPPSSTQRLLIDQRDSIPAFFSQRASSATNMNTAPMTPRHRSSRENSKFTFKPDSFSLSRSDVRKMK